MIFRSKPDPAIIAQDHITGQRGIGCQKTVFADYRVLAFNMKNISHSKEFSCAENVLHRPALSADAGSDVKVAVNQANRKSLSVSERPEVLCTFA